MQVLTIPSHIIAGEWEDPEPIDPMRGPRSHPYGIDAYCVLEDGKVHVFRDKTMADLWLKARNSAIVSMDWLEEVRDDVLSELVQMYDEARALGKDKIETAVRGSQPYTGFERRVRRLLDAQT